MAIVESLPSPTLNRNNLLALTTPWVRHGALMYKKMKAVAAQEVSCCVYDNPPQKKKIICNKCMKTFLTVRLLGQSGCSSPPTKGLHDLGQKRLKRGQERRRGHLLTEKIYFFSFYFFWWNPTSRWPCSSFRFTRFKSCRTPTSRTRSIRRSASPEFSFTSSQRAQDLGPLPPSCF